MIYLTKYRTASSSEQIVIEDNPFPQRVHWQPDTYARAKTGMVYPPQVMTEKVVTKDIVEYIRNNPTKGKTGFILAGGSQGWAGVRSKGDNRDEGLLHYKYKIPLVTLTNIFGGRIASTLGEMDYCSTDASACASGIKVLMEVQNLINNFGFTRMIVLAVEDQVNNSTLEFFGRSDASLLLKYEENNKPSAFDPVHHGFNLGQGAALAIFETDPPETPEAEFLGAYTASEDFANPLGQRPDGMGYQKAILGALEVAKLHPSGVKLVKTHGTGTPVNNQAEKTALVTVLKDFVATSYKQRVGHTLAASGLMETGLLLDDLKRGVVPGILNRTNEDDVFLSHDIPAVDGVLLSLAAGMGNTYSAALFRRLGGV